MGCKKLSYYAVVQRIILSAAVLISSHAVLAADLPPHSPLRILIVSDTVNPHGLPSSDLTESGDISATLVLPGTGLNISETAGSIVEFPTNSIELATEALSVQRCAPEAYDVLIYFSHRIPNNGSAENNAARQEAFTLAVENFLIDGGGMISFHHGSYISSGKQSIQSVIGATASGSVPWDVVDGQNVINVAPGHFITTNAIEFEGHVSYGDPQGEIPQSVYKFFNNTPDERYPSFNINNDAAEFKVLFGSNYSQGGNTHLLGFTHKRPEWKGMVFGYQPGEYQPNALDDLDGNNFQILANAIVFLSTLADIPPSGDIDDDGGVGVSDLILMLSYWGDCPDLTECCPADLDEDGTVSTSDIIILFEQWD